MVQYYTKKGVKALEKMSHVAASKASESLSQLINQSAEVKTVSVRTISIQNLSKTLAKPTEIVSSIVMEVHGDVNGSIMLVYPEQSAFNVADFLSKRALGTTQKIDELDKSALKESGNIVAGAFLGRLSDYVNVNMVESTPELITNELKIVVDEVVSRFGNKEFAEAIAFEIMYEMSSSSKEASKIVPEIETTAYFILMLDKRSAEKLATGLETKENSSLRSSAKQTN